jgi:hypothetical protein
MLPNTLASRTPKNVRIKRALERDVGPFSPEYNFSLDGVKIAGPGNGMPKPQRQVNTSLLLISGTP